MKRLIYVALGLAALWMPRTGIAAEAPRPFTQEWLDLQWLGHIQWRLEHPETHPVEIEIYCRDLLKVVPVETATADKLVEYYTLFRREPAMAAMAARYANLLDPASPLALQYWEQIEKGRNERPANPESDAFPGDAMLSYEQTMSDAMDLLNNGKLVLCENSLRSILYKYPRHLDVLKHLGSLYVMKSEWAMSTMAYGYALELAPQDIDLANNYALCLDKIGQTGEALKILDEQFKQQPRIDFLARNCGRLAMKMGNIEQALDYYSDWVGNSPNSLDAWLSYGDVLIRQEKDLFAQAAFSRAHELDKTQALPMRRLAEIAARRERAKDLRRWARKLKEVMTPEDFGRFISQPLFDSAVELKKELSL